MDFLFVQKCTLSLLSRVYIARYEIFHVTISYIRKVRIPYSNRYAEKRDVVDRIESAVYRVKNKGELGFATYLFFTQFLAHEPHWPAIGFKNGERRILSD